MHLVAVDLTTGSMAFCVSKEKSIPAVCNIFDSIMHLQKALRSLREKSWKNNLLFASPSIRRPTQETAGLADTCAIIIAVTEGSQYELYKNLMEYRFQTIFRVDEVMRRLMQKAE